METWARMQQGFTESSGVSSEEQDADEHVDSDDCS